MEIIKEKDFAEKVKSGVVVIDFFATWCGPCRMMGPILEETKEELGDSVSIYKVDVDEDESLAREYGIMSIPTLFVFVNGQVKEKHVGLWMKDDIVEVVKKYL